MKKDHIVLLLCVLWNKLRKIFDKNIKNNHLKKWKRWKKVSQSRKNFPSVISTRNIFFYLKLKKKYIFHPESTHTSDIEIPYTQSPQYKFFLYILFHFYFFSLLLVLIVEWNIALASHVIRFFNAFLLLIFSSSLARAIKAAFFPTHPPLTLLNVHKMPIFLFLCFQRWWNEKRKIFTRENEI